MSTSESTSITYDYDYIVIGSGFGGSVSACRLSEKGYHVAVIEQGKHKRAKDFAASNWNIRKYLWAPLIKCFGPQRLFFFKDVLILGGVGVGGGSLVYANTHMTPDDKFFRNPAWAHIKDWKSVLMPFYGLAKFMLGTTKNPKLYIEDDILRQVASDMNQENSFDSTNVGVYFGEKGNQVDPYFNGEGPLRQGCTECAGCMVGCRYNAKNTLDKNYLWFAQKNGAEIIAETKVTKIEPIHEGGYRIHTQSSTNWFAKKRRVFTTKGVVLSAGVLGSLNLLFKNRDEFKTMPNISVQLGTNVRTNSETITGAANGNKILNHGIAISSVFQADEHTHIEICKFSDNSGAMSLMALPATDDVPNKNRGLSFLINLVRNPKTTFKWIMNPNFAKSGLFILVMQNLESSMKMIRKRGLFGTSLQFDNESQNKIPAYIPIGQEVTRRYSEKIGGIPLNSSMEVFMNMSTTAHILGGCPMGEDRETGVVNDTFALNGYDHFYVLDGSIIPCNLGVNPSLTITTLSEYAMSHIPAKKENVYHVGYHNLKKETVQ